MIIHSLLLGPDEAEHISKENEEKMRMVWKVASLYIKREGKFLTVGGNLTTGKQTTYCKLEATRELKTQGRSASYSRNKRTF